MATTVMLDFVVMLVGAFVFAVAMTFVLRAVKLI